MTDLKGYYQVAMDIGLAELLNMVRASGIALPPGAGGRGPGAGGPADDIADPSGTSSMNTTVQALGLRLESRKAVIEQLVIDHVEKTPTEN
jgi:uncharacterized protein (TIGR03435 family)